MINQPDSLASDSQRLATELARAETGNVALQAQVQQRWYPSFHIAAKAGWINDPNGLSHFGDRYQVFFQHHPYSTAWGPMHWGHVSSENMVTWRREPIALAPTLEADRDGVFSGSAVTGDDGLLYAYYTGHRWSNGVNEDEGSDQVQCLATSADGVTFEKKGVVVEGPAELPNFRDPKVFREGETWYMVFGATSAEHRGQVWMYTSADMLTWNFDRILFEDPDPNVFMLECPDFFKLGDHWVLIYCPMGVGKRGYESRNGHNAGYVVGNWEPGGEFEQLTDYRLIDWGHNFYAPQTFETADGRRVGYGWMGSFTLPLASQAEDGWAGQLTVPREFTLGSELSLRNAPIAELEQLRGQERALGALRLEPNESKILLSRVSAYEFEAVLNLAESEAERIGFKVGLGADGSHAFVGYDDLSGRVFIDRRLTACDGGYRAAPAPDGDLLKLRVLVDRGSIEVFVNDGAESVTSFAFFSEGERKLVLTAESGGAVIESITLWDLDSIWEN